MALNYVSLTCDLGDGQGNYLGRGLTATLAPTAVLTDSTDHLIAGTYPVTVAFNPATSPPVVSLIATDNANILPSGWAWTITPPSSSGIPAFSFYLPHSGGASQYLSALAPVYDAATMQSYLPLPSGTPASGQVPIATGTGEASAWGDVASTDLTVRSVTSATTLTSADGLLLTDCSSGDLAVTLPSPSAVTGQLFYLKRIDTSTNYVSLNPYASELIDGGLHAYLGNSLASLTIVSDGTNWWTL